MKIKREMKMKNQISIIILAVFLLFSCGKKEEIKVEKPNAKTEVKEQDTVELTNAELQFTKLDYVQLEERVLSDVINCTGILDVPPQNLISISLAIGGNLKRTSLLPGIKVSKGQILAEFEHQDYIQLQQDYLEAKANLDYIEQDFKRQEILSKDNVSSEKNRQKVKSEFQISLAKTNALKQKLSLINISIKNLEAGNISSIIKVTSPISGYVSKVNTNIGKYSSSNDVVFELINTEHIHAELSIFEKDLARVQENQKIRFNLANETQERIATVHLIGRSLNADKTISIHGHLAKEDNKLTPGTFIKARIEVGNKSVLSLPDDAIASFNDKFYVFTYISENTQSNEQNFKVNEVRLGIKQNGYTEVILSNNFDKSAKIVKSGINQLTNKLFNKSEE